MECVLPFVHCDELRILKTERLDITFLCKNQNVIGLYQISQERHDQAVPSLRAIFAAAILYDAAAIIASHNHPSGSAQPSPQDYRFTRTLKQLGAALDICLLDHVIITRDGHYSFREAGLL